MNFLMLYLLNKYIKRNKLYFEKCVALSNGNKKIRYIYKKANNNLIKNIQSLNLTTDRQHYRISN